MSKASISRFLAVVLALTLVGAACSDNDESDGSSNTSTTRNGDESTVTTTDNAEVTLGGTLYVGLEAETNSWKPGEGSFSNPGVMVALAILTRLHTEEQTATSTLIWPSRSSPTMTSPSGPLTYAKTSNFTMAPRSRLK